MCFECCRQIIRRSRICQICILSGLDFGSNELKLIQAAWCHWNKHWLLHSPFIWSSKIVHGKKHLWCVFLRKKMAAGHGIFYNSLLCCCGKKKLPKGGWITIDGLKILKGAEIGRCCQLLQCAQNEKAPRYFYILSHLWKESERPAHHLFNHPFSVTSHVSGF